MIPIVNRLQDKLGAVRFYFKQRFVDRYSFIHINKCGGTSVEQALNIRLVHDSALQRRKKIGRKRWADNFTFAVVRHPYAKVVSHYNYRVKTNQTDLRNEPLDLNAWVKASYGEKNPEYYDQPLMFAPCWDWITEDGKIIVDRVVKLENLNDEWRDICRQLNVAYEPLPAQNRTSSESYQSAVAQLNEESLGIINVHFAKDFEEFGYEREVLADQQN